MQHKTAAAAAAAAPPASNQLAASVHFHLSVCFDWAKTADSDNVEKETLPSECGRATILKMNLD